MRPERYFRHFGRFGRLMRLETQTDLSQFSNPSSVAIQQSQLSIEAAFCQFIIP
jgi:hypothetical protein